MNNKKKNLCFGIIIFFLSSTGMMAQEKNTTNYNVHQKPEANVFIGFQYSFNTMYLLPPVLGASYDISAGKRFKIPIDLRLWTFDAPFLFFPVLSVNLKYYFAESEYNDFYFQCGIGPMPIININTNVTLGLNCYLNESIGITANFAINNIIADKIRSIYNFNVGICF